MYRIKLIFDIGRTHQCRGQMNVLGPDIHIAGDNMYVGTTTPLVPDGYQSSAFLALQVMICYLFFHFHSYMITRFEFGSSYEIICSSFSLSTIYQYFCSCYVNYMMYHLYSNITYLCHVIIDVILIKFTN